MIRRALLSVSDKTDLVPFAKSLSELGVELLATGGTRRMLAEADIPVVEVASVTGFPEMMNGRVKTLHPKIHGGILALRDQPDHVEAMEEHGIGAIDLVIVNLYPFEETKAKPGVDRADVIEQIDIGGPSMVRSAAKNHRFVGVVTDPADYDRVLEELRREGELGEGLRRELARKAFALTARYDSAISNWLFDQDHEEDELFPETFTLAGRRAMELRYGENPHQKGALYHFSDQVPASLPSAEFLGGKALSYNNLVDLDAAIRLASEFADPFAAVTKHNNPCGAACGEDLAAALADAWEGDPLSAFGSVLAFTRPVDLATAEFLVSGNRFVEAIAAPAFDEDALERIRTGAKWGKNVRLLACGPIGPETRETGLAMRPIAGGFLLQEGDVEGDAPVELEVVTRKSPDDSEIESLRFADLVCKHVKSNAIVIAKGRRVLGVGAGQMSRVDSVELAVKKSGDEVGGSVLASDAFFPFPDGVERAMEAGVTAILQPGGSIRDKKVIEACDAGGIAMVFSHRRHFRH
ncbi:MAG TPA: bifunctional phosphoribosylaminoimidazolecarboxamide formyltransferase/IMP cyclohydrolase [Planctomycetes bacterium]|nr:bifunctional phosphoribosylaminoimidazolecarboxamide formyltransferase/IMP cyclohydrolase [Planctomycetota bacterium]